MATGGAKPPRSVAESSQPRPAASLRLRLALGVGTLCVLLATVLILASYNMAQGIISQQIKSQLQLDISTHQIDLLDRLESNAELSQRFAEADAFPEVMSSYQKNGLSEVNVFSHALPVFNRTLRISRRYESIWLLDTGGRIVALAGDPNAGLLLNDHRYFLLRGREPVFDVLEQSTPPGRALLLATPILYEDEVVGILMFKLRPAPFLLAIENPQWGVTSQKILVGYTSGDSVRLLTPPSKASGQFEFPVGELSLLAAASAGGSGFSEKSGFDGERKLAAYRPVGYRNWGMVMQVDRDEALAPIEHLRNMLILLTLGGLAVSLALAYVLTDRLARRIELLTEAAHGMASGELDTRVAVDGRDEVSVLAYTFNQMADSIQQAQQSLEQEVVRRRDSEASLTQIKLELEDRVAARTQELGSLARDLQRQTQLLQTVLDNVADGVIAIDQEHNFLLFSEAAALTLGLGPHDRIPENCEQFYGLHHLDRLTLLRPGENPLNRALEGDEVREQDIYIANRCVPDGRFISASARPLRDVEGRIFGAVAVIRDVTQIRRSARLLQESEERLRTATEAAGVATWDWNFATGELTGSDNLMALHRMQPSDFHNRFDQELKGIYPADRDHVLKEIQQFLEDGRPRAVAYRAQADPAIWLEAKGKILERDEQGKPTRISGVVIDITERKRAEAAVRISEARFRKIFEEGPLGMAVVSRERRITTANAMLLRMLGREESQVVGQLVDVLLPQESGLLPAAIWEQLERQEIASHHTLASLPRPHDEPIWASLTVSVIHSDTGEPLYFIVMAEDVTERKRAEVALRASEERYALALRGTTDGLWDWDIAANRVYYSDRFKQLLGYPSDAELGPGREMMKQSLHPDDRDRVLQAFDDHLARGIPFDVECRIATAQGEHRWYRIRGEAVRDFKGKSVRMAGGLSDVTERKQAEQALQASEARFRSVAEFSPLGLFYSNMQGDHLFVNARYTQIFGYPAADLLRHGWTRIIHPEDAPRETARIELCLRTGEVYQATHRAIRSDGAVRWISVIAAPVRDQERLIGYVGTVDDITERRAVEQALHESEVRFRTVAEASPMGLFYADAQGNNQFVNRRYAQIAGCSIEQMLGRNWQNVFHPDDVARIAEDIRQGFGGRDLYQDTFRIIRPDGEVRWVTDSAAPVRDGTQLLGIVGTIEDITERRAVEQALRESEARFRSLAESNMIGVAFWSLDGRIVQPNHAFVELVGRSEKELAQLRWRDLTVPGRPAIDNDTIEKLRSGQSVPPFETELIRATGERLSVLLGAALVTEVANEGVAFALDLTKRKEAEAEVRRLYAELEQEVAERTKDLLRANKELEAFNYSVSHDLRGPLRSIDGYSLMLYEKYHDQLDAEARHDLERIRAGVGRMTDLIDALLHLSRATRMPVRREDVNLSAVASDILNELQQRDPSRKVDKVVAPDIHAQADPHLIRETMENLLGNAWKFTAGTEPARIEFGTEEIDGERTYFVRDNGAGFDMAYVNKLFRPFQRLHTPTDFPGAGVGLASAYRIIERHGGKIWAHGAPGQGATFHFTL